MTTGCGCCRTVSEFHSRLSVVFAKSRQRRIEMSEMRTRRLRRSGMLARSDTRTRMQVITDS
jgi:hypothetical protein